MRRIEEFEMGAAWGCRVAGRRNCAVTDGEGRGGSACGENQRRRYSRAGARAPAGRDFWGFHLDRPRWGHCGGMSRCRRRLGAG